MNNTLFFILILSFLFSSCKREDETILNSINSTALDCFGFAKNGSYWVYKDSINGDLDTFIVSGNTTISKTYCYYKKDEKEVYVGVLEYNISTTYTNERFRFKITADCTTPNQSDINIDYGPAKGNTTLSINDNNNFIKIKEREEYNDSIITSYQAVFTSDGITYKDVYHFDCTNEGNSFSTNDYWVAKKIGIVKFNSKFKTWILIDKKIIL